MPHLPATCSRALLRVCAAHASPRAQHAAGASAARLLAAPPLQQGGDYDGARATYDDNAPHPKRRPPNATGGLPLGGRGASSAAAAAARVAAASQLAGPEVRRCELCAATFVTEREMALHLEGAAHRKALERQAAEAERRRRLGAYADMASSAVEQAAWQGGQGRRSQQPGAAQQPAGAAATGGNSAPLGGGSGGSGRGGQPPSSQQGRQQQGRQQGRGAPGHGPAAPAAGQAQPHARDLTSHEEMLRQARGPDRGPLDIDGWVPPTLPQPAAPAAALQQGQQTAQQQTAAPPAAQPEQNEGAEPGLLGGLVSYSEDEEDDEGGAGSGSSSQEGAPAVAAPQAAGQGEGEQQLGQQHPAPAPGASADSDDDGSSSGGSEGEGGHAPVSFFTF